MSKILHIELLHVKKGGGNVRRRNGEIASFVSPLPDPVIMSLRLFLTGPCFLISYLHLLLGSPRDVEAMYNISLLLLFQQNNRSSGARRSNQFLVRKVDNEML